MLALGLALIALNTGGAGSPGSADGARPPVQVDAPTAPAASGVEEPPALGEPAPEPGPGQAERKGLSLSDFPRDPWGSARQLVLETGQLVLRPFTPTLQDALIIVPVAAGVGVSLVYDTRIYHSLRRGTDPVVGNERLSYWISYGGEGAVDLGVFVALGAVGGEKERRVAMEGVEALAATALLSRGLKLAFREERPSFDGDHKHFFGPLTADSFPGGHTMAAFTTAAVIAGEYPQLTSLAYGIAGLVAVARVQEGAHWLSDDLVGALLGYFIGRGAVELHAPVAVSPFVSRESTGVSVSMALP